MFYLVFEKEASLGAAEKADPLYEAGSPRDLLSFLPCSPGFRPVSVIQGTAKALSVISVSRASSLAPV